MYVDNDLIQICTHFLLIIGMHGKCLITRAIMQYQFSNVIFLHPTLLLYEARQNSIWCQSYCMSSVTSFYDRQARLLVICDILLCL